MVKKDITEIAQAVEKEPPGSIKISPLEGYDLDFQENKESPGTKPGPETSRTSEKTRRKREEKTPSTHTIISSATRPENITGQAAETAANTTKEQKREIKQEIEKIFEESRTWLPLILAITVGAWGASELWRGDESLLPLTIIIAAPGIGWIISRKPRISLGFLAIVCVIYQSLPGMTEHRLHHPVLDLGSIYIITGLSIGAGLILSTMSWPQGKRTGLKALNNPFRAKRQTISTKQG